MKGKMTLVRIAFGLIAIVMITSACMLYSGQKFKKTNESKEYLTQAVIQNESGQLPADSVDEASAVNDTLQPEIAAHEIKQNEQEPMKKQNTPSNSAYQMAPEFSGITGYINTEPLTMQALRGSIVIVDFWTFGCINCQHEYPTIRNLFRNYNASGVKVVSVHTPEFGYEKIKSNVEEAALENGLTYPILLDNDWSTWHAFGNRYWPRVYVIDRVGRLRGNFIGEGHSVEIGELLDALLKESS